MCFFVAGWTIIALIAEKSNNQREMKPLRPNEKYMSLAGVKSVYRKTNFLISQPKHMLWVLKRAVSMRRFFWAPKTYVKTDG